MAIISRPRGYLFLMAPRTGSTAIERVLVEQAGGERYPASSIEEGGRVVLGWKHCRLPELRAHGLADGIDDLLLFTTVRNPFDSMVSLWAKFRTQYSGFLGSPDAPVGEGGWVHGKPAHYREQIQRAVAMPFPAWVEWRLTSRHFALRRKARPRHMYAGYFEEADVVMRFERLQADFEAVLERLGLTSLEISRVNGTERSEDYRSYYTPRARRLVEDVYRPDLERFGYRFEAPEPASRS